MKEKTKYFAKNLFLFSLSGVVPKALAFILVPLYTNYLTTAEYGIADLITVTVSLMLPIATLNIQDAVMRYSLEKDSDPGEVLSIGLKTVFNGGIYIIVLALIAGMICDIEHFPLYLFFGVLTYFTSALNNILNFFCRAVDHVSAITVSSIINSAVMLLGNIIFVAVLRMGLSGYLISSVLGPFVAVLYIFFSVKIYRYIKKECSVDLRRQMLQFSAPLIIGSIAWWINNSLDRYMITFFIGVSASGLFAISSKIPNILVMFQQIFSQAWSISAIKEFDRNDGDGFIGKTYTVLNMIMILVCSGIIMMDVPLAYILYSKDFFQAWLYVPPLLLTCVFNAMALFINSLFIAVKDTKARMKATVIGMLVNVVCNLILIQVIGVYGAALSTMISGAVSFVSSHFYLKKYIRIKTRKCREAIAYFMLIVQMILALWGTKTILFQIVIFLILIMFYRTEIRYFLSHMRRSKSSEVSE